MLRRRWAVVDARGKILPLNKISIYNHQLSLGKTLETHSSS